MIRRLLLGLVIVIGYTCTGCLGIVIPHTEDTPYATGSIENLKSYRFEIAVDNRSFGELESNRKFTGITLTSSVTHYFQAKFPLPDGRTYASIRRRVNSVAADVSGGPDWKWIIGVAFYEKVSQIDPTTGAMKARWIVTPDTLTLVQ